MELLPNEVLEHILSFLTERSLAGSRRVSRRWKQLCESTICRKPIVNIIIACSGVKPLMTDVHNVLVANEISSSSMLQYLNHIQTASLTFCSKTYDDDEDGEQQDRDERQVIGFAETFIRNNSESLQRLYINNNTIFSDRINLPRMLALRYFFMDYLNSDTLESLVAGCPNVEEIRFRTVDDNPLCSLPSGLKVFANRYIDDDNFNHQNGDPLNITNLVNSPAAQTLEVVSLFSVPEIVPELIVMPKLRKLAVRLETETDMQFLVALFSSATTVSEISFKITVRRFYNNDAAQMWNRLFSKLRNLEHLRIEGIISTEFCGAVSASCTKLKTIVFRTFRCDFRPDFMNQLAALDHLSKIDVLTERLPGSLDPIRDFVMQKPRVSVQIYAAVRPMSRGANGELLTTQLINSLNGRGNEHVHDLGPIRKQYHAGSIVLSVSAAEQ